MLFHKSSLIRSFHFAWRYLKGMRHDAALTSLVYTALIAIALSAGTLALVMSIMQGFEQATTISLQSINPPVILESLLGGLDSEKWDTLVHTHYATQIRAWAPTAYGHAVVQKNNHDAQSDTLTRLAVLKGIDPEREASVTALPRRLVNTPNLQVLHQKKSVLIGQSYARMLEVTQGDEIILLVPGEQTATSLRFERYPVTIVGFFNTGIEDIDDQTIICSLETLEELAPEVLITEIGIVLTDTALESQVKEDLMERLDVAVYSWKKRYPALVAALKLERYAMAALMFLIMMIAGTNISALVRALIIHKRRDIALLNHMGCPHKTIRTIFIMLGLVVSFGGCCLGLMCALSIIGFLQYMPLAILPDAYYISSLPAVFDWWGIISILVGALLIGLGTSWMATRSALKTVHKT